jgi:hypothetical protein
MTAARKNRFSERTIDRAKILAKVKATRAGGL